VGANILKSQTNQGITQTKSRVIDFFH
jgi:hypothetical protein